MTNLLQAHTALAQTQAALQVQMVETNRQLAETNRRHLEFERRFDERERINAERFVRIEALLLEHSRILEALPDAVRQRMGFAVPERPGS